jgi:hypothetical protein
MTELPRVAYADPPYRGQSRKHYRDHPDYAGGTLRMDIRELLIEAGIEPTDDAIRKGADTLARVARDLGFPAKVVER